MTVASGIKAPPGDGQPRWWTDAWQRRSVRDVGVAMVLALLSVTAARNVLQDGFPPGVDTPTFLHMSWFTRETLLGNGGLTDPYWYGGFPIFAAYPPLSHAVVGGLAAIPGIGLIFTYKVALLSALAGTGIATYVLARQLGNAWGWSALAGALTILAYPMMITLGLWGWFSTAVALPFCLLALAAVERAYHGGSSRYALAGGLLLGLGVLAHHMTAFAFALGLPGWALFYYLTRPDSRGQLYRVVIMFAGAAVVTAGWWVVPWATTMAQASFEREVPGLWSFRFIDYLRGITNRELIGFYAYPTYLGFGLILMAVGGAAHSLITPSRSTPYGVLLLLLVAISLGEQVNPLLRIRPLDGLDVARFQLYLVPVTAVVGLPFLATLSATLAQLVRRPGRPGWVHGAATGAVVALVLGQAVWDGATASRRLFEPYRVTAATQQAIDWFKEEGEGGSVLGVGFWHWDDFLLPYYLKQPVVDGWHDEGADNWRTVRRLRTMMWSGDVDAAQVHRLLGELDGQYVAIQDYFTGESPTVFRAELRERPDLFDEVADWGEVTIFQRIPE